MELDIINGYELVNQDKAYRALHGTQGSDGSVKGGVIKEDGSFDANELLAEYDRLGGLLRKNGDKVKTGSFYDFPNKQPHKKPKVFFTYSVNGRFVDVPEGQDLPGEVKAVKVLEAEAKKPKAKKK